MEPFTLRVVFEEAARPPQAMVEQDFHRRDPWTLRIPDSTEMPAPHTQPGGKKQAGIRDVQWFANKDVNVNMGVWRPIFLRPP